MARCSMGQRLPRGNKLMRNAILAIAALATTSVFAAPSYVAVPLGTFGGPGSAGLAINADGVVTGYAYTPEHAHAFVHEAGTLDDLGTVDGVSSYGTAINASGQVAGYGYTCLLYTSDAADDLLCVDLGGRRIIK